MSERNDDFIDPADLPPKGPSLEGGRSRLRPPVGASAADEGPRDELILHDRGSLDGNEIVESSQDAPDEIDGERSETVPAGRRRLRLPLILFLTTCLSTFWVGASHWLPIPTDWGVRQTLLAHWHEGLLYMACVLAILIAHEMGHFLTTVRYRIPASFPYFIPFPISPIGTMGAVIGMDGLKADRKELFDIGLAGPLAGLVVAVPVMWYGLTQLDFSQPEYGPFAMDLPLAVRMVLPYIGPTGYDSENVVWFSQLNPYFMAGWVGLLITGLNMMPVSQLDGGHVVYTLLGRKAHWVARIFIITVIALVAFTGHWRWSPMILLVLFIGPDHPPTRDDSVELGRVRMVLGFTSILIPILCFPIRLMIVPA